MLLEMNDLLDQMKADKTTSAVILASSKEGMFCSGADLKERLTYTNEQTEETVKGLRSTFHKFYTLPMPVIACMDGMCLGGGLELALACDIRVSTRATQVGVPEVGLAIIPGAGGTARLPRLVGPGIAREMVFTGERYDTKFALEKGMVNFVEEDFELALERCKKLAKTISNKGPLAIRAAKLAMQGTLDCTLEDALKLEEQCYAKIVNTEDRIEGLKSFVEKRRPSYQGK